MTKLIAEVGINHLGDKSKLMRMISDLHSNKIDSCKLQYRASDNFFDSSLEMGSTLISQELDNVNLDLSTTVEAVRYGKSIGIEMGVSFFRSSDVDTFCDEILPDFFKVPSAEALNYELIKKLQSYKIPVIVSTGGLDYKKLNELSENVNFNSNDCIMYCVANYPAADGASIPHFIQDYKQIFNCKIGYSSHDTNWEMNIAFLGQDIDFIERHYTEDKKDEGLDISTSSDMNEMIKLQKFCNLDLWHKNFSIKEKIPNQGELQNIKDLGSSYYFKHDYKSGEIINLCDFEIRSPCRGIKVGSIEGDIKLARDASSGEALTLSHVKVSSALNDNYLENADSLNLSIPVRLHDFQDIEDMFGIKNYEWHLSYKEVPVAEEIIIKNNFEKIKNKNFSIHLPDYISSNHLIDPISSNNEVKNQSLYLIDEVSRLSSNLQDITGNEVPIVGSFSVLNQNKEDFYAQYCQVISDYSKNFNVKIMPQFLPRLAWYFGGSVKLDVFCSIEDFSFFKSLPYGICLDTAHCIMAANYEGADPHEWIKTLLDISQHMHISDAIGVDGEGVKFGSGDLNSSLELLLKNTSRKVIEQWEGHLNNFEGFKESVNYLINYKS